MSGKPGGTAVAGDAAAATDSGPISAAATIKREEEQRDQNLSRSKRGGAKKRPAAGGGARASGSLSLTHQQAPEPLALNPQQGEFVRVVKVCILYVVAVQCLDL